METLINRGAKISMETVAEILSRRGITATPADVDKLVISLRIRAKESLDEAMKDAKDAIDANMHQVATATFAASFRLVGIHAVSDVFGD